MALGRTRSEYSSVVQRLPCRARRERVAKWSAKRIRRNRHQEVVALPPPFHADSRSLATARSRSLLSHSLSQEHRARHGVQDLCCSRCPRACSVGPRPGDECSLTPRLPWRESCLACPALFSGPSSGQVQQALPQVSWPWPQGESSAAESLG